MCIELLFQHEALQIKHRRQQPTSPLKTPQRQRPVSLFETLATALTCQIKHLHRWLSTQFHYHQFRCLRTDLALSLSIFFSQNSSSLPTFARLRLCFCRFVSCLTALVSTSVLAYSCRDCLLNRYFHWGICLL